MNPNLNDYQHSGKYTLDNEKKLSLPLRIIMWFFISISICIVLSKIRPLRYVFQSALGKLVAWDNSRRAKRKNKKHSIITMKKKLFASMEETIEEIGGPVLEIGAGSAPNLEFYPPNTKLWIVDLSEHFKSFLDNNLKKHDHVKLDKYMLGNVENMEGLIDDNSCSVVVSSCILCCVDQPKVLSEIMRVLKPGGRLYFIEHVAESHGSFTRWLQSKVEPFWKKIKFNCHLTQQTNVMIENAGFTNLQADIVYRDTGSIFNSLFARSYVGHCTKPKYEN